MILSACTITPEPIKTADSYKEAKKSLAQLFATEGLNVTIDYQEALARGIRYNYDYRLKLVNKAIEADQLKVAEVTMFPDLKTTGSIYSRSNDYATSSTTSTGAPTDVLSSTPRTLRSMREGFSWNLLDFGVSYLNAKQQGERVLITEEESRKQLQLLAQDIRIAYWKAYSAQSLKPEMQELRGVLKQTEKNLNRAIRDKLIPKEEILRFRSALLGGQRQYVQLRENFDKASIELKQLLDIPLNSRLTLKAPPKSISKVQNLKKLNFEKLDTLALILRPELRSQKYMERIAEIGVKSAIVQVFPGVTLNKAFNYNSNKFLLNNTWVDESVDMSFSLLNLVSLPRAMQRAKTQVEYEKLKSQALTLAVLTQTRFAYKRYMSLAREYAVANKQAQNAFEIYKLAKNKNKVALASSQEVVFARLQYTIARMDRDLVLADLSTSLGELYLSAGFDLLPMDVYERNMTDTVKAIKKNYAQQDKMNFVDYVNYAYGKLLAQVPNHYANRQKAAKQKHLASRKTNAKSSITKKIPKPFIAKKMTRTVAVKKIRKPSITKSVMKPVIAKNIVKPAVAKKVRQPLKINTVLSSQLKTVAHDKVRNRKLKLAKSDINIHIRQRKRHERYAGRFGLCTSISPRFVNINGLMRQNKLSIQFT